MTLPTSGPDPIDHRPLHQRIAADLREEIMNGDLAPGTNLPSTTHLRTRFEASAATIQKALHLLKEERLVVGRPGSAVTVREKRHRVVRPAGSLTSATGGGAFPWLAETARHGGRASVTLLDVRPAPAPADVAAALGLPGGTRVHVRSQLLTLDDEPVELVTSYYPSEIARDTPLAQAKKIRGGTPTLLTELGFPPRRSVDRVSARVPTQEQYARLRLPSDLPVLRTLRTVYSDDDRPVEATVMVKAGHLYELQYEFAPE
ncbi:GntR family transcriptional regulator [Streptomyces sp. NPDC097619]|uniref:GntR family transcriptional regulator n=1 Tax=Streptomyces sp. NPDC097619 TaxID=3157228 RepID=UPI0033260B71